MITIDKLNEVSEFTRMDGKLPRWALEYARQFLPKFFKMQRGMHPQEREEDLKKKCTDLVKSWVLESWRDDMTEKDFQFELINKLEIYNRKPIPSIDECRMQAVQMISSLPELKQFRDSGTLKSGRDIKLLDVLIRFIEEIRKDFGETGLPMLANDDLRNKMAIHYRELFLKCKGKVMPVETAAHSPGPVEHGNLPRQASMHIPGLPPQQPHPGVRPVMAPQQQVLPPKRVPNPPPQPQPNKQAPQTADDCLKKLFAGVRTDCAVFFSTPHPPHF